MIIVEGSKHQQESRRTFWDSRNVPLRCFLLNQQLKSSCWGSAKITVTVKKNIQCNPSLVLLKFWYVKVLLKIHFCQKTYPEIYLSFYFLCLLSLFHALKLKMLLFDCYNLLNVTILFYSFVNFDYFITSNISYVKFLCWNNLKNIQNLSFLKQIYQKLTDSCCSNTHFYCFILLLWQ